jgi:hypothetical protein
MYFQLKQLRIWFTGMLKNGFLTAEMGWAWLHWIRWLSGGTPASCPEVLGPYLGLVSDFLDVVLPLHAIKVY